MGQWSIFHKSHNNDNDNCHEIKVKSYRILITSVQKKKWGTGYDPWIPKSPITKKIKKIFRKTMWPPHTVGLIKNYYFCTSSRDVSGLVDNPEWDRSRYGGDRGGLAQFAWGRRPVSGILWIKMIRKVEMRPVEMVKVLISICIFCLKAE